MLGNLWGSVTIYPYYSFFDLRTFVQVICFFNKAQGSNALAKAFWKAEDKARHHVFGGDVVSALSLETGKPSHPCAFVIGAMDLQFRGKA